MNLKEKAMLASMLLWGAGTAMADVNFQITVNDKSIEGKTLLLRGMNFSVDSAVVKNGKAVLTGTGSEASGSLCSIGTRDKEMAVSFFMDGTPIVITNGAIVKGSESNLRMSDLNLKEMEFNKKVEVYKKKQSEGKLSSADSAALVQLYNEEDEIYKDAYEANKNNLVGLLTAYYIGSDLNTDDIQQTLDANKAYSDVRFYKNLERALEGLKKRGVGKQYIDLAMADTTGVMHRISEYVGKGYLLVDFWASWCGPCRRELPNVKRAYDKYHEKGFDVLGISFDNKKEAWTKAIRELDLTWHHISDLKGWQSEAAKQYAVTGIPCTILLDKEGNIVASNLHGEKLEQTLSKLLK